MEGDRSLSQEVLRLAGEEVRGCIQCGTCSSSCSLAHLMDNPIRKLIRLALDGDVEGALKSDSIWLCTSCLLCTVRCPRGIKPKSVVLALRHIYEKEKRHSPDQAFEDLFMEQVRKNGRISEFELSALYPLYNIRAAVPIMTMGIELIPRGKISRKLEAVKGLEEMERLFTELGEG